MKNYIIPVVTFFFALSAQRCYIDIGNSVTGNGHVAEESRDVRGFNSLKVSNGLDVIISQNDNEHLNIEADENLLDHIKTEVSGNELRIFSDVNIRMAKSKKIYLSYRYLRSVHVSSAGDLKGQNKLKTDNLELRLSSAGDLNLEVDADKIDISVSSSGDATLRGRTGFLKADLSSAGNLNAFDLEADKADISASSAADARVFVISEARFKASSAGDIVYRGNPNILEMNTSSGGDVSKRN